MPGGLTVLLHLIRFLFTEMLQSEATSHLGCASRNRSALAGFSIHGDCGTDECLAAAKGVDTT